MNYNPYAAPPSPSPGAPNAPSPAGFGPPQPWTVGEVVERGWALFKNQWAVLVPMYLITAVIGYIPGGIASVINGLAKTQPLSREYFIITAVSSAASLLMQALIAPGQIRILVAVARGEQADVGMLFSAFDRSLPVLGTIILSSLATVVGLLFFIVPGIYIGCALFGSTMYTVDGRLAPMDALRASLQATRGQRGPIFLMQLMCGVLMIGGFIACCVGVIVAAPLTMLVQAIVYLRISGRGDQPQAPPPYAGPVYGTGYNG